MINININNYYIYYILYTFYIKNRHATNKKNVFHVKCIKFRKIYSLKHNKVMRVFVSQKIHIS